MSSPALRVALFTLNYSPEPSGIAPYSTALAEGLASLGHSVSVTTALPHYPQWRVYDGYPQETTTTEIADVRVQRVIHYVPRPPRGFRRLWSEISFGLALRKATLIDIDIVVMVSPALIASAIALWNIRRRTNIPTVVWVQDLYAKGLSQTNESGASVARLFRMVEGWLMRSASSVVTIHERFASYISTEFRVPSGHVSVVRNWTHILLTSAPPSPSSFGWTDGRSVVVHAGNMGVKQGLDNVVAAARLAEERHLPIRFVLMGDGGERERLESLASGLTSIDIIDSLPSDRFVDALRSADVMLVNELPDLVDMSVPSKLTSYFASGRPVIAATNPRGITADEIRASGAGHIVDADSPEALVDAVMRLRDDPEERDALGRAGHAYFQARLTSEAAISAFESILMRTASAGDAPQTSRA